jgi:phage repressor protein C with HTH and peptisase S24 domain
VHAYPEINERWLLLGEGEMLKSTQPTTEPQNLSSYMQAAPGGLTAPDAPQRVQASDNLRILTVQVAPDGDENIELVPVWAAAGYAAGGFIEPTFMSKLPSFRLPGAAFNNGSFRAFQVHGSSMQGTLEDGDWIICRYVEKWAHDILDNRVYVVVSETDILVKRVLNQINENGRLTLHSDNPTFDVQTMDWQDVREVWQGVARLTLDLTNTRLDLPTEFAKQQALLADMLRRLDKLEENTTL